MQIDLRHPALTPREAEGLELCLSLHRIYRDQGRMRESYTSAMCAMRLWHLWTRDEQRNTHSPTTIPARKP